MDKLTCVLQVSDTTLYQGYSQKMFYPIAEHHSFNLTLYQTNEAFHISYALGLNGPYCRWLFQLR